MKSRTGSGGHEGSLGPQFDENDSDFRRHIRNTIILLGGKKEIADLVIKSQDYGVTNADVDELKKYNHSLIDQIKGRLDNISKMTIRTGSAE